MNLRARTEQNEVMHEGMREQNIENGGYNRACIDWEKFLPNEDEIKKIIIDKAKKLYIKNRRTIVLELDSQAMDILVNAISKRIGSG